MSRFAPRRLRWRLTLSYTLVTTAVVLGLEIALFSWLIAILYRSELLPSRLADHLVEKTAELALLSGGDDLTQAEVQTWMDGLAQRGSWVVVDENGLRFSVTPADASEAWLLIVDENGQALGGTQAAAGGPPGRSVVADGASGQVLRAALAGKTSTPDLYGREADGTLVAAAPVFDLGGRLQGALLTWVYLEPDMGPGAWAGVFAATLLPSACVVLPLAALISLPFGYLTARGLVRRLERIAGASQAWSSGDFSHYTGDESSDELGQLARRLDQMAAQLQTLLAERREMAILEERNRLALELHDSVKQQAFAVSAQLAALRSWLGRDPAAAEGRLAQVERQMDELRQELANLILKLRPPALEGRGLAPALQEYLARWTQQTNLQAHLQVGGDPPLGETAPGGPGEVEQALFRIAQEALANVARHSGAQQVELNLSYTPQAVTLAIRDDGSGFEPGQVRSGVGLRSMRERAAAVGATLSVESTPGQGTCVAARWTYPPAPSLKGRGV